MTRPKGHIDRKAGRIPTRDEVVRDVLEIRASDAEQQGQDYQVRRLRQALRNRKGRFALLFAVGNDPAQQHEISKEVFAAKDLPPAVEISLAEDEDSILAALLAAPGAPNPLVVFGIEKLLPSSDKQPARREQTLQELQYRRELFRTVERPILIWMPEYVFALIGQQATDFWSWQSGTFFFTDHAGLPNQLHYVTPEIPIDPLIDLGVVRRRAEFETARDLLSKGRNVVIRGVAGSGKTMLALAVADSAKESFPDGTVMVSVSTTARSDAAAETALGEIVRTLVPTANLPSGLHALRATYDDVVQGRRILVVANDVPDAETARLLTPPAPSRILMTSRKSFDAAGADAIMLGGLEPEEAIRLLRTLVPDIDDRSAAQLTEAASGSPMLLRLMAGALKSGESRYSAILPSASKQRPIQLRDLVDRAVSQLKPEPAQIIRRLSVFDADFDRQAAIVVADASIDEHLELIAQFGLLNIDTEDRLRLHPLVRELLRERVDPEENGEARLRHALYFMGVLKEMDDAYNETDSQNARTHLQSLQVEWPNIRQGQSWVNEHQGEDSRLAYLTATYPLVARNVLSARLSPNERLDWFEAASKAAEGAELEDLLPIIYEELANAHRALGNRPVAKRYEERALAGYRDLIQHADRQTNLPALLAGFSALGTRAIEEGRYRDALACFHELQRVSAEAGLPVQEGVTWLQLGRVHQASGELERAEESYMRALEVVPERAERGLRLEALSMLGDLARFKADLKTAEKWYEQALAEAEQVGHTAAIASAFLALGEMAGQQGDLDRSELLVRRALEFFERLGDISGQIRAQLRLSAVAEQRRDLDAAEHYASRALQSADHIQSAAERAFALRRLGRVVEQRGDLARAIELYRSSADLLTGLDMSGSAASVYFDLARSLNIHGEIEASIAANLESVALHLKADPKRLFPNLLLFVEQEGIVGRGRLEKALRREMAKEDAMALLELIRKTAEQVRSKASSEK